MKTRKLKSKVSSKEKTSDSDTGQFPIVGIGASAGGLEALEQFLGNVPENSGMAYVVIQHLDPTQKGMLPELLQRISKMKVFQVKDRMAVKAKLRICNSAKQEHVYIKGECFTCLNQLKQEGCVFRLIFSYARLPTTGRNKVSVSFFQVWAPMAV